MATASRALLCRAALSPLPTAAVSRRVPLLLRPLAVAATLPPVVVDGVACGTMRRYTTQLVTSSLQDSSPSWSNRLPKETTLLDGCDFEHWLIVMEQPPGDVANPEPTRDEIINSYIKTLAQVLGSKEEARMKIYSVSTHHYFSFGALVSEELSYKLKELPKVR